jgi:hypothetical protein
MMNDKDILKHIDKGIDRRFRAPNVIVKPEAINAISERAAVRMMQPYVYYLQTTNATPTNITVVEIEDNECGKIHVEVETVKSDGTAAESIERIVHYKKTGGVLTINSMWDIFAGDLAVTLLINNDGSDNIKIEATGIAATVIDWECYVKQRKIIATALP